MSSPLLLAASYDLQVYVYDMNTMQNIKNFDIPNSQANRIVVSDQNFYIASYSYIFSYNIQSNSTKYESTCVAHENNVTDLCVNDNFIVSCGEDKMIRVWDKRMPRQNCKPQINIMTDNSLNTMFMMNNDTEVVVGGETGSISIWDIRNSNPSSPLFAKKDVDSPVRSLAFDKQSNSFVAAFMNGMSIKYKVDNGKFNEEYNIHPFNDVQLKVAISPNGQYFAVSAADNCVKTYHLNKCDLKNVLIPNESRSWIWDMAFTSDSSKLCTCSSDGICRIWDVENCKLLSSTPQLPKTVSAIALME